MRSLAPWPKSPLSQVMSSRGRVSRLPCKDDLKGTCTTPFCEKWHPQNACSTSPRMDAGFGKIARLMKSLAKGLKKNGDKSTVAMLEITRQLGGVFQDMEPPKSSSILRKSSNIRKPIRCVRFTEAVVRHANIRDQNPSLGMICPGGRVTPMLQNLRIGLRKRRNGKSDVPAKQRGGWPKVC